MDFTVSGVYFHCPMIGPDILPKSEIQDKIKSFLLNQLEDEKDMRGLTACLIIHTLNKNKEKVSFYYSFPLMNFHFILLLHYLFNVSKLHEF